MHRIYSLLIAALIGLIVFSTAAIAQDSLRVRRLAEISNASPNYAYDVALDSNRAYVCSWGMGLTAIDISRSDTLIQLNQFFPPC